MPAPSVIPVLVPVIHKGPVRSNGRHALPTLETMTLPVAVTAARGRSTPYPVRSFDLTIFQGGEMGLDPLCLSFGSVGDLLARNQDELTPKEIYEARARIWDVAQQDQNNSGYFDRALAAGGFCDMNARTPDGDFKVHLYDNFIAYSEPHPPGPFRMACDNMAPEFQDRLERVADPGDMIFRVAAFYPAPPSSHVLLRSHQRLAAWLTWLAQDQGWPAFAPIRSLSPWEV
jgi:hypothetical protein